MSDKQAAFEKAQQWLADRAMFYHEGGTPPKDALILATQDFVDHISTSVLRNAVAKVCEEVFGGEPQRPFDGMAEEHAQPPKLGIQLPPQFMFPSEGAEYTRFDGVPCPNPKCDATFVFELDTRVLLEARDAECVTCGQKFGMKVEDDGLVRHIRTYTMEGSDGDQG